MLARGENAQDCIALLQRGATLLRLDGHLHAKALASSWPRLALAQTQSVLHSSTRDTLSGSSLGSGLSLTFLTVLPLVAVMLAASYYAYWEVRRSEAMKIALEGGATRAPPVEACTDLTANPFMLHLNPDEVQFHLTGNPFSLPGGRVEVTEGVGTTNDGSGPPLPSHVY
mmetsp:Transcript_13650/g.25054  ORF Transcript_13650/g.25054 Transcript_13650/m.25054 type:complete len:170 (-) Transcript_13650:56-565(-)